MIDFNAADIAEDDLLETFGEEVLQRLLRDHSTFALLKDGKGREDECHIIWATADYADIGDGFGERDQITIEKITGTNSRIIVPRALKSKEVQRFRTQDKAEVFSPAWLCNAQNNLVDEAWFGRKDVFNTVHDDNTWQSTTAPITFPEGKTWQDYVADTRLEITCGEAPYIVSRYDTTTGILIPLSQRIGLLDRKLRVVGENCADEKLWLAAARKALQSVYGYEWQGDNLLLAREAVFITMIEYYKARFGYDALPPKKELLMWAYIISWNLWQMDGLKMVVPMSCHEKVEEATQGNLFEAAEVKTIACPGCEKDDMRRHNGTYCLIREWPPMGGSGNGKKLRFIDLIKS